MAPRDRLERPQGQIFKLALSKEDKRETTTGCKQIHDLSIIVNSVFTRSINASIAVNKTKGGLCFIHRSLTCQTKGIYTGMHLEYTN